WPASHPKAGTTHQDPSAPRAALRVKSSVTHGSLAWKILILSCSSSLGISISIYLSRLFSRAVMMVVPVVES
ncbi:unnamed protein product, partial [Ectocarpus sp. 12 AP-2014]